MANAWLCCYVQCEIVCSTVCRMIRWMYQMISNSYRCLIFYAWSTASKSKTVAIRFASTLTLFGICLRKNQTCNTCSPSRKALLNNTLNEVTRNHSNSSNSCSSMMPSIMSPMSFQLQHSVPQNFSYSFKGLLVSASALAWTQAQQNSPDFCLASKLPSGTRRCWIGKNRLAILCD